MRLQHVIASVALVAAPFAQVSGSGTHSYIISKTYFSFQKDAAGAIPAPSGFPYFFNVQSSAAGTLTLPDSFAVPLSGSGTTYGLNEAFDTATDLTAVYPSGTYTLTGAFPTLTYTVGSTSQIPASIPQVNSTTNGTWTNAVLAVDPTQAVTLTIPTFTAYATAGVAGLIEGKITSLTSADNVNAKLVYATVPVGGANVVSTPVTSLTIPANTLTAGLSYLVEITFNTVGSLDTTTIPGAIIAVTYTTQTNFFIGATGSSSVPAPAIAAQPTSQTGAIGGSATFTPRATYGGSSQEPANVAWLWHFNGTDVNLDGIKYVLGAGGSLTINNLTTADIGLYYVTVITAGGAASSQAVSLTVTGTATLPSISLQPVGMALTAGQPLTLSVVASGSPAPTYQWQLNGVNVAGATQSTLDIPYVGTNQAGAYTVVVTNSAGSVTSNPATVTVNVNAHLINLSSRSYVGTGAQVLVAGFVVSGSGTKQVLIRGDGPALTAFSIAGALARPVLSLFDNTSTAIATDTGWGNTPVAGTSGVAATFVDATTNVFNQVYAFNLPVGSADSAMLAGLPSAAYTAEINGVGNTTGVALAELYDADTGAPTAHLINLSARAFVNTGSGVLVAGFVISGTGSETVLIRGVGPTLGQAPFNLPGALAVPQLTLYDGTATVIAANTGWSTAPSVGTSTVAAGVQAATAPLMASLYAFSLPSGSADCAMVVTLPPGAYTAQVSGVGGTTGVGLVEVYDVPSQ